MSEGAATFPAERWIEALVARVWWLSPVLVALLAAALAEIGIDRPITGAEAETMAVANGSWQQIWEHARSEDFTQLATWALWKPWLAIAGTADGAVRVPSLVTGSLACATSVLVGARLLGWTAGTLAGVLLATNSFVVSWSQTVSGLMPALLLAVAATYLLLKAADGDRWTWWVAYAAVASLAAWMSLATVPLLAAHAAYVALRVPRPRLRCPLVAGVGILCALAPFVALVLLSGAGEPHQDEAPTLRTAGEAIWAVLGGNPVLALAAAAGAVVLAAQWASIATRSRTALLVSWLAAPLVLGLLVSVGWPAADEADLLATAPAAALLAAAAVASQRPAVAAAAGALFAAAAAVTLADHVRAPVPADWRAAAHHVAAHRGANESVVVTPPRLLVAFSRYAPDVAMSAPGGKGVWLLIGGATEGDTVAVGRALVGAPAYALLDRRSFGDELTLQHWVRP